ncbi:Cytochrome P450 monooxygenase ATR4, partial [Clarias magur]
YQDDLLISVSRCHSEASSINPKTGLQSQASGRGVKVSPSVSELQADGLGNYLVPEEDRHADYHMTRHYDGMRRPRSRPQGWDTLHHIKDPEKLEKPVIYTPSNT